MFLVFFTSHSVQLNGTLDKSTTQKDTNYAWTLAQLDETPRHMRKITFEGTCGPFDHQGHPRPKSSRMPLRCRSSNSAMRKGSTTSGSRRSKNPVACNFDQNQGRQAVDFILVSRLDKNPETKVQGAQTFEATQRRDEEGAQACSTTALSASTRPRRSTTRMSST